MNSMADNAENVVVTNNRDERRYEARVGEVLAGVAEYQQTHELIVFTHTEVDASFEGKGIGSALAKFALDEVRDAGELKVMPLCPFIKAWIARHRDYIPLVYGAPVSTAKD